MPNLNNQNLDSYIMFYGRQKCQPDEFFQGDNLRKNDIFYYIISGTAVSYTHLTLPTNGW